MTITTTTATTPDYDEIVRVVQLYIDGWQGNVNKFKEAFHADASIFFTDAEGVLHKSLLTDRFAAWAATKKHIVGRVIAVTQAEDVAASSSGSTIPQTRRPRGWTSTCCCGSTASRKSQTRPPPTAVRAAWAAALSLPSRAREGVRLECPRISVPRIWTV